MESVCTLFVPGWSHPDILILYNGIILPLSVPGWSHPGNFRAHGPDDPLAEHDEPQGDADAPVERDEHWGIHLVLMDYAILHIASP